MTVLQTGPYTRGPAYTGAEGTSPREKAMVGEMGRLPVGAQALGRDVNVSRGLLHALLIPMLALAVGVSCAGCGSQNESIASEGRSSNTHDAETISEPSCGAVWSDPEPGGLTVDVEWPVSVNAAGGSTIRVTVVNETREKLIGSASWQMLLLNGEGRVVAILIDPALSDQRWELESGHSRSDAMSVKRFVECQTLDLMTPGTYSAVARVKFADRWGIDHAGEIAVNP
ncbi:hypothetical protein NBCG_03155 [Nocardioidaceae bacterium Broad-1]|nr:hypothetical protein NBCG_03155 [Nocardioidaceae bacterium Broad-1]